MGKNVDFMSVGSGVYCQFLKIWLTNFPKISLLMKKFTNPLLTSICPLTVLQSHLSITMVHCWVQSYDCSVVSNKNVVSNMFL